MNSKTKYLRYTSGHVHRTRSGEVDGTTAPKRIDRASAQESLCTIMRVDKMNDEIQC